MVKLINAFTGVEMWVADNRVDEYVGAGHKPCPEDTGKPTEEAPKRKAPAKKKEK